MTSDVTASDRFTDGCCLLFGLWTVLCHLAVVVGAGLDLLLLGMLAVMLSGVGVWIYRRRREPRQGWSKETGPTRVSTACRPSRLRAGYPVLALIPPGLLAVAALGFDLPPWMWWGMAVVYLLAVAVLTGELSSPATAPDSAASRQTLASRQPLLWGLAVLAVMFTHAANRPDKDDAFYLGIAVAVADFPDQPLLRDDPVHGVADMPMHHPAYRLHALEVAVGAAARLTGVAAIYWAHFVVSGLGAMLLVFSWARLMRLLVPGRWVPALGVLLLIFATVGDAHCWYSNFAFVRLHQGKAIFAAVLVPLTIAYALEFALAAGASPERGKLNVWCWLKLAACQAAAVGVTPVAVWLAPVVASLALLAAAGWSRRGLRIVLFGGLASFYPVLAGATVAWVLDAEPPRPVRTLSHVSVERAVNRLPPVFAQESAWDLMTEARDRVFGDGALPWWAALACLIAWWLVPQGLARRVCLIFPLGFLVLCFNPPAAELAAGAAGDKLYWRSLWVLPVPLFIALCLTSPLAWSSRHGRLSTLHRHGAVVMLSVAFVILVPERQLLSRANGVSIRPFGLKVSSHYRVAEAVVKSASSGSSVLAPLKVSPWIVTFHRHPSPLVVRKIYLPVLRRRLERADVAERRRLADLVTGGGDQPVLLEVLLQAIPRYRLGSICLRRGIDWSSDPEPALVDLGFERFYRDADYEIWRR